MAPVFLIGKMEILPRVVNINWQRMQKYLPCKLHRSVSMFMIIITHYQGIRSPSPTPRSAPCSRPTASPPGGFPNVALKLTLPALPLSSDYVPCLLKIFKSFLLPFEYSLKSLTKVALSLTKTVWVREPSLKGKRSKASVPAQKIPPGLNEPQATNLQHRECPPHHHYIRSLSQGWGRIRGRAVISQACLKSPYCKKDKDSIKNASFGWGGPKNVMLTHSVYSNMIRYNLKG